MIGNDDAQTLRIELAEQQAIDLRHNLIDMAYFNSNYDNDRLDYLIRLPGLIEQVEKFLGTNTWVAGDTLTYADFLLYDALDFNRLFDPNAFSNATIANAYLHRFENIPQIKAYMTSGKYNKLPVFGPMASWGGQRE